MAMTAATVLSPAPTCAEEAGGAAGAVAGASGGAAAAGVTEGFVPGPYRLLQKAGVTPDAEKGNVFIKILSIKMHACF